MHARSVATGLVPVPGASAYVEGANARHDNSTVECSLGAGTERIYGSIVREMKPANCLRENAERVLTRFGGDLLSHILKQTVPSERGFGAAKRTQAGRRSRAIAERRRNGA